MLYFNEFEFLNSFYRTTYERIQRHVFCLGVASEVENRLKKLWEQVSLKSSHNAVRNCFHLCHLSLTYM